MKHGLDLCLPAQPFPVEPAPAEAAILEDVIGISQIEYPVPPSCKLHVSQALRDPMV